MGDLMEYRTEKVSFKNNQGDTIDARFERPEKINSVAIFAHCFTCSKDIHAAARISRALTDAGIAVLRFDFTGLGNSDGDFANTNFTSNVADLVSAYNYLSENVEAPEILIGHSLGGAAVLSAASSMPAIKLVTTIGAPSDVAHLEKLLKNSIIEIESSGQSEVSLAGRTFTIKKQFLDDVRSTSLHDKIRGLKASLLIFHAPGDQTVEFENAQIIYKTASQPKSLISLEGASHLLDKREDSEFVANVISAWCLRYLNRLRL